jgi:hypothetical protein
LRKVQIFKSGFFQYPDSAPQCAELASGSEALVSGFPPTP